jgi:hypothetical protein
MSEAAVKAKALAELQANSLVLPPGWDTKLTQMILSMSPPGSRCRARRVHHPLVAAPDPGNQRGLLQLRRHRSRIRGVRRPPPPR